VKGHSDGGSHRGGSGENLRVPTGRWGSALQREVCQGTAKKPARDKEK